MIRSASPARTRLALALSLALLLTPPAGAQTPEPAAAIDATPAGGFAPILAPTVKRGRMPAGTSQAPYTPIQASGNEAQIAEIDMFVGESRVVPAPGVARIAVGNGKLLTAAALDEKEVILFANAEGTSSLFIWNADGRYQRVKINIVAGDTSRHAREIAAFLSGIPNAKTSIIGANIVVEGEQLSDFDLNKIETLAKRYPQIVNFTDRVGWEKMIAMDIKVVEFPTSVLQEVGLKWNGTGGAALGAIWGPGRRGDDGPYQLNLQTGTENSAPVVGPDGSDGGVVIPKGLNILSVINMGLNAQLNLLAQEGKATLLAEPQLSARNGAKASFLAGGELPYAVSNRDGTTILFKPYGIKVDITPRVDAGGVIRATIESEVSSIDRSVTTAYGPTLLTRKTNTEFNVRDGETMVLAGLLQRDASTDIDKVPLLGDIPVLGALFRSKRVQNKETELVVFVTPRVVSADSPSNRDRIQRTTEKLEARLGAAPYLTDPLQPGVSYEKADKVPQRPGQPAPDNAPSPVTAEAPLAAGIGRAPEGALLRVQSPQALLRLQPNASAEVLLTLERGATVVLGSAPSQPAGQGLWTNVHVGALNGWLQSEHIVAWRPRVAGQPDMRPFIVKPVPGLQPALLGRTDDELLGAPMRVQSEALPLRVTPEVNAAVVWRAQRGDVVRRLSLPPQGAWVPVQIGAGPTGKRGWVLAQWLVPLNMP